MLVGLWFGPQAVPWALKVMLTEQVVHSEARNVGRLDSREAERPVAFYYPQ